MPTCYLNGKKIIDALKELHYEPAFKQRLQPQGSALEAVEWEIDQGDYLDKMPNPTINDQGKYLKLPNEDETVCLIKTLMLGDLTSLFIKRVGENGYILYFDSIPAFSETLKGNKVLGCME